MKILLISSGDQPLIKALHENLCRYYPNDTFERINYYKKNPLKLFAKIPVLRYIYRIMLFFSYYREFRSADLLNIHYVDSYTTYIIRIARLLNPKIKIVTTVWGSDFNIIRQKNKNFRINAFKNSNAVSFTSSALKEVFNLHYDKKFEPKLHICRFGLGLLDQIKEIKTHYSKTDLKQKLNIKYKFCVLTGTNAQPNQQHEKIIEQLIQLPSELKKDIIFLFPLTYGADKEKVKTLLRNTDLNCLIFEKWLTDTEISEHRIICDVMLQLQSNDQLSGAMQEALFAGNQVITGSWLDYPDFTSNNIQYKIIDDFHELNNALLNSLPDSNNQNDQSKITNEKAIWKLSSWENNIHKWYKMYSGLISH